MEIILLHPSESKNLGDKIILKGTKKLLSHAFGDYGSFVCNLDLAMEDEAYLDSFNWGDVDLFVLSGTPWLWDKAHQSKKYDILQKVLSRLGNRTRKVALGIGSCFPLASNIMEVYLYQKDDAGNYEITRRHTREKLHEIFSKFDFVFTRDILAYRILQSVGVNAYHSICPAAFIDVPRGSTTTYHDHFSDILPDYISNPLKKELTQRPLLVFINPFDGVSQESCDRSFMEDLIQFQKWFKEEFNPRIVTMDPLDRDWCTGQNWDVTWLRSPYELLSAVDMSSFVVSGRVHASIPAALSGKPSFILPWDTRYLTAVRLGVIPILTSSDMDWWGWAKIFKDSQSNLYVTKVVKSNLDFLANKLREVKP